MKPCILIATNDRGITRAALDSDGRWAITRALGDLDLRCIAGDPLHAGRVFAGSMGSGVWRSDDSGVTWHRSGLGTATVTAIACSPHQSGLIYAGTLPARLYRSSDAGATWREVLSFAAIPWRRVWLSPAGPPFLGYVQAIAASPTDPRRIVVGIEAAATLVSTDGGKSWTGHRPKALRDCHSLAFHATNGDWVYTAGGTGGGAAVSRDGGTTWERPNPSLDRGYGWAVAADPSRPDVWFVSASTGPTHAHGEGDARARIYRLDGLHWEHLAGGLPDPLPHMPYALLTDRDSPGSLWAGLSNGDLWHSRDCGDTWSRLPVNVGAIRRSVVML